MPTKSGGKVPLTSTVIPYTTAAETLATIVYTAGDTNAYAAGYTDFYETIAATAPDQTDSCTLTKCLILARGCASPFLNTAG